jgi:hypothetical protein
MRHLKVNIESKSNECIIKNLNKTNFGKDEFKETDKITLLDRKG